MLHYDEGEGVATLSLCRTSSLNAFATVDWERLSDMISAIDLSKVRALVLRSDVPGAFCSGSNLKEIAQLAGNEAARTRFRLAMERAMTAIGELRIPVIAEINGACFGAGVALALSCDIRLAGPDARFGITPAKIGISYPYRDLMRLKEAIGRGQAARLLFGAGTINAQEAERIRLIDQLVPDAKATAQRMAAELAANAPESIAVLKSMLSAGDDDAVVTQFDKVFERMFGEAAFHDRIATINSRNSRG